MAGTAGEASGALSGVVAEAPVVELEVVDLASRVPEGDAAIGQERATHHGRGAVPAAEGLERAGAEEAEGAVLAGGDQEGAVLGEGERGDLARVLGRRAQLAARLEVEGRDDARGRAERDGVVVFGKHQRP